MTPPELLANLDQLYFHSDDRRVIGQLIDVVVALNAELTAVREELQRHKEQTDSRHTNMSKRLDGLSGVHGAK
jgi:hypothetical protein